jgi:hypothetical protein
VPGAKKNILDPTIQFVCNSKQVWDKCLALFDVFSNGKLKDQKKPKPA